MSAQYCPSCMTPKYEGGRCSGCGFVGAEYKLPRTALPLGSVVGKYRIGVMKTSSRQSQIYTAVHTETSAPAIIEEFFPNRVAGRQPGNALVMLAADDDEFIRRYQQGCLLYEASAQKRPLNRKETIQDNNTVYTVFEPVGGVSLAAQCESLADNPVCFRDGSGTPMMTINLLPIPPMPKERAYDPDRKLDQVPDTGKGEGFENPIVTEINNQKKKESSRKFVIIAIVAALVLAGLVAAYFLFIKKPPVEGGDGNTPTPVSSDVVTDVVTDEPTEEVTEVMLDDDTPEPGTENTATPDWYNDVNNSDNPNPDESGTPGSSNGTAVLGIPNEPEKAVEGQGHVKGAKDTKETATPEPENTETEPAETENAETATPEPENTETEPAETENPETATPEPEATETVTPEAGNTPDQPEVHLQGQAVSGETATPEPEEETATPEPEESETPEPEPTESEAPSEEPTEEIAASDTIPADQLVSQLRVYVVDITNKKSQKLRMPNWDSQKNNRKPYKANEYQVVEIPLDKKEADRAAKGKAAEKKWYLQDDSGLYVGIVAEDQNWCAKLDENVLLCVVTWKQVGDLPANTKLTMGLIDWKTFILYLEDAGIEELWVEAGENGYQLMVKLKDGEVRPFNVQPVEEAAAAATPEAVATDTPVPAQATDTPVPAQPTDTPVPEPTAEGTPQTMPPAENPQPTESNLPGAPQALNADGTNEDPDWNKVPKPEFNEWRNVQWWANDHYIATSNKVRKVTIIVNNQEIELVGTPYPGPSWTTKYTVPEGTELKVGIIYEVKYYMSGNLVNKDYLPKLQK